MLVMVLIFAGLAFLVPTSWVKRLNTMIEPDQVDTSAVFEPSTAELDAALRAGALPQSQRPALKRARAAIQVRRLSQVGPMTGEELEQGLKHLREGNPQVDREPSLGSRKAMHREVIRRALKAAPRVEEAAALRAMDAFDAQYVRAMGIEFKPSR